MRIHLLARSIGLSAATATLVASTSLAQIKEEGTPAAVWAGLQTDLVPIEFVQPPDVDDYMEEDELNGHRPLRYGALLPVNIGHEVSGVWDRLPNGTNVWRFKVYSPGAHSIGLEFDEFTLPEGSQVFMYNDTLERVYGAYGSVNNQPNGQILFEPFPGDSVIFEYVQPVEVSGVPDLHLGTVIYDYRDVVALVETDQAGSSGAPDGGCGLVDVNCPEGDAWELQKRATVRTLSSGSLCSGALLNNTSGDETRYVYTANHCGQGSNTVFLFKYQRANCGSGSSPSGSTVSGATVLTSTSTYDSRLMRINNNIPTNYNAYYAGWSRSTSNPSFAFSMGHPSGGPKKISIDSNGASKGSLGAPNSAWQVNWDVGYLLGGSSGGPLFDQNGRVIGPACCVSSFTCSTQSAWYGRFDRFYSNNNISQWLDPTGVNPTTLDGFDPQNPGGGGGGGGGGTTPSITSTVPASIYTVNPESSVSVTLNGDGFAGTTSVEVDGAPLAAFPPQFQVISNTEIKVTLPPPHPLGTKTIKVIEGAESAEIGLPVSLSPTATIDLVSSNPSFLLQALPLEVYMSSLPFDTIFLLASTSLTPTVIPGILSAGIGNNLTDFVFLGVHTAQLPEGYAKLEISVSGLPTGLPLHFQAGVLSSILPVLPLTMTNIESGTILF